MPDSLEQMFVFQKGLMKRLGVFYSADTVRTLFTAITVEMAEVIQELNWKPWKKTQKKVASGKVLEELVDVLFFYLELCIVLGFSHRDIFEAYKRKLEVNNKRIDTGY